MNNWGIMLQPLDTPWQRRICFAVFFLLERFGIPVSSTGLLRRELRLHVNDFAELLRETGLTNSDYAYAEVRTRYAFVRVRPWT